MKAYFTILFLFLTTHASFAQNGRRMERIHALKVSYITDRLHFNSQQSAQFWPVYDQYESEVRNTRQAYMRRYRDNDPETGDDSTSLQFIDDNLDYQQEMINLKKGYKDRFLAVISPQQLAELYKADREFKQMLLQQLRQRRQQRY